MLMAAPTFVFLIFSALCFSAVVAAQKIISSNIISLGSSLSPSSTNSSWLSPSGRLTFGFYPQGNGFAIGIWFAQIPQQTVVWTSNPDDPPLSTNATLNLTSDGRLILQPTQQDQPKSIAPDSQSASWASMLDTGNFVLYNSSGKILWQSFDSPTNTLLPGQRLFAGKELFSSVSETDQSIGIFRLKMQNDGNLVQYPTEAPDAASNSYWASVTNGQGDICSLNLDADGCLHLMNTTGYTIRNLFTGGTPINRNVFYRMTIDFDSLFRVYPINGVDQKSNWSINWESTTDKCDPKGLCGLNGYCSLMNQTAVCSCIPGFNFINESNPYLGCQAKLEVDQSCGNGTKNSISVYTLVDTEWEENQYSVLSFQTEGECQKACLEVRNCEAATFKGQVGTKRKLPLRYGVRIQDTSTSFTIVKISRMPCSPAPPTLTDHGVTKESKCRSRKGRPSRGILIISLGFNACAFLVLAFFGFLVYRYRVWAYKKVSDEGNIGLVEEFGLRSFTYGELEKVTEGFKEVVGRGTFSTVFKGTLSNGTRTVAVKRLDKLLNEREREFQTEVRVITKTHHRNLVQLLGYCCDGPNRILVYEYKSNGPLADLLFNSGIPPCWHERVEIALNIAKGILYLHEECDTPIIHCDIKPQNILMDQNLCPKIADFGLSKMLNTDQTRTQTQIRGTRGYVAPEWY